MQEKDIRAKLNQELDEMAPDILNKILAEPIEPVKSEKELFSKKPLFKEKKKIMNYFWAPAITAIAACVIIAIMIMQPSGVTENLPNKAAFNIIIDVNPSISISVNKDGTVKKVKAGNKDAKKIVREVNKKVDKDTTYNKAVKLIINQLNKEGYLKKKKSAMLLSVVSDDKKANKDTAKEIKENAQKYKQKEKIKCAVVYQNCEIDKKIEKVAEKNKVSVGKAAFCMKIAEKEKVDVDKICKKNIYELIKEAEGVEKTGTKIFDKDTIEVFSGESENGNLDVGTEDIDIGNEGISFTDETESVSEEFESANDESESTSSEDESVSYETESMSGEEIIIGETESIPEETNPEAENEGVEAITNENATEQGDTAVQPTTNIN